jgi:hypothetical protein
MEVNRKEKNVIPFWKWTSICLLVGCLTFLTTINYFLYPSNCNSTTVNYFGMSTEESENDFPPSGPTEEKSTNSSGITLAEEMLHETHPEVNFDATNHLYLHHIAEAEKLEIFHPEILLPPPKFKA